MSAAHCRNAASRRPMPVPEDGAGRGAPATGDAAGRAVPFASPSARCPADTEETAPGTGAGLPSGMRASPGAAGDAPPFSPASGTEAFPLPATGAAVVPPPRRRLGELLPSAGVASGAGATGVAAVKGAAAGTGSGKEAAGTVSVPRAAVRADDASLSGGAGKSSQSSSPGSTTRPPPDDDRPYSAARRSASAASAAASVSRSADCRSGTGAVVGPASPADAGAVAAAFLRPRPPEVGARPARETALRRAPE